MEQVFVLEATMEAFVIELQKLIKNGYKQVSGSMYTKSIETDITSASPANSLGDVLSIFSVSIQNDRGTYSIVVEENPDDFFSTLTGYLEEGYKIITGSVFIDSLRTFDFVDVPRCYSSWYACTMCK